MHKRLTSTPSSRCAPARRRGIAVFLIAATVCIGCAGTPRYTRPPGSGTTAERVVAREKKTPPRARHTKSKSKPKSSQAAPPRAVESTLLPLPRLPRFTPHFRQRGSASYYASKFHGRRTASGERYDKYKLTAAHPTLPFGTRVTVTNLSNGASVTVRINDRGPFTKKRIIDLSYTAAKKIGMIRSGTVSVMIETAEP